MKKVSILLLSLTAITQTNCGNQALTNPTKGSPSEIPRWTKTTQSSNNFSASSLLRVTPTKKLKVHSSKTKTQKHLLFTTSGYNGTESFYNKSLTCSLDLTGYKHQQKTAPYLEITTSTPPPGFCGRSPYQTIFLVIPKGAHPGTFLINYTIDKILTPVRQTPTKKLTLETKVIPKPLTPKNQSITITIK